MKRCHDCKNVRRSATCVGVECDEKMDWYYGVKDNRILSIDDSRESEMYCGREAKRYVRKWWKFWRPK